MTAQWIFTIGVVTFCLAVFVYTEFGVVRQANQRADKAECRAMDADVRADRAEAQVDRVRETADRIRHFPTPENTGPFYADLITRALDGDAPKETT